MNTKIVGSAGKWTVIIDDEVAYVATSKKAAERFLRMLEGRLREAQSAKRFMAGRSAA